jgi:hypothetical protein
MNCKEAGIELCPNCSFVSPIDQIVWVEWYGNNIRYQTDRGIDLKEDILAIITQSNTKRSILYYGAALKELYPEYYDWFEKMLVLR